MKQKIVVKVYICCDKCRKEALKIAATAEGVKSVTIQGKDEDEVVVEGVGVDSVDLCAALRKKLRCANLKSVEEMKDPKPKEEKKNKSSEKNSEADKKPTKEEKKQKGSETAATPAEVHHHYCYPNPNQPQCYIHTIHYEDNPNCAIM